MQKMFSNKTKVIEIIFEAKFASKQVSLGRDEADTLSKNLRDKFNLQNYNNEELNFINKNKDIDVYANVFLDKVALSFTDNINFNDFINYTYKFTSEALNAFKINDLSRLGFRIVLVEVKENYNKTLDTVLNITNLEEESMKRMGHFNGYNIKLGFKEDKYFTNITVTPGQQQRINHNSGNDKNEVVFGVIFDVDFFTEGNHKANSIKDFLNKAQEHIKNNVVAFYKTLGVKNE